MRLPAAVVAGAIEQGPVGLVVLTRRGAVRSATGRARELLRRYLPPAGGPSRLPAALDGWLKPKRRGTALPDAAGHPLIFERGETLLIVRRVAANGCHLLLLEERITALAPKERRPTGPTPRETDVLVLVAQGHSNREIASRLNLSPRTVDKHLEQIYARLTLAPRDGAVNRALRALSFLQSARPPARRAGPRSPRAH
jgi:DNA-binding CsgD family transcriptional regulator